MENYFSSEIKTIQRELTRLKTSMNKSAGVVQTVAQSVDMTIPLQLAYSGTSAIGYKYYRIVTDKNAIVSINLEWYSENVLIDYEVPSTVRKINIAESEQGGVRRIAITAHGSQFGTNSDVSRLERGETVTINNRLTVRATCNFVIEEVNE